MAIPIFTLNLAYINDYIAKEKFVAAGAGLQIIFGMGAMGGPLLCSIFVDRVGRTSDHMICAATKKCDMDMFFVWIEWGAPRYY